MKKQLTDMFQFRKALSGHFLVHFQYGYTEINVWQNDNHAIVDCDNIEVIKVVLNKIYNDYKTTIIINKKEYKTILGVTNALSKIDFSNKKYRRL
jgi:hypothetical protein